MDDIKPTPELIAVSNICAQGFWPSSQFRCAIALLAVERERHFPYSLMGYDFALGQAEMAWLETTNSPAALQ